MIGAQTDQAVQEHLIEKYMLLPNQVWDSIIQQATKVRAAAEVAGLGDGGGPVVHPSSVPLPLRTLTS